MGEKEGNKTYNSVHCRLCPSRKIPLHDYLAYAWRYGHLCLCDPSLAMNGCHGVVHPMKVVVLPWDIQDNRSLDVEEGGGNDNLEEEHRYSGRVA